MNAEFMNDTQAPLGFLGGAFDPVHIGHLRGAIAAREWLGLERVDLIPAAQSPLKDAATVSASHRLAMLRLAVAEAPGLSVDGRELDRPGPSYTVETLQSLRQELGDQRALFWIIGADNLETLPKWSRWQQLLDLVHLAVIDRPGARPPSDELAVWLDRHRDEVAAMRSRPHGGVITLKQPLLDIASSDIRAMIAAGRDPRFLIPDSVMEYISQHVLFSQSDA